MSLAPRDSASSPAERLAAAALEVALEDGLEAVTARAVARRAGVSASSTAYHFGGQDALVARLLADSLAHCRAWRAARRGARASGGEGPVWRSTAAAMAAEVSGLLNDLRPWLLLMADFEARAEIEQADLLPACLEELDAWRAYWDEALAAYGVHGPAAELWGWLAQGLTELLTCEADPAMRMQWLVDPMVRLEARLAGRAAPAASAPDPALRLLAEAPTAEGARRILDAAISVIARKGAARATQREVAAEAGLSLAAVTYFFRTKADLISAAFHELHRRIRQEVLESPAGANRPTLAGAPVLTSAASRDQVRAMQALSRAAARDSGLRLLVSEMRVTRGATSLGLLQARNLPQADGLDGFIWSVAMGAVFRRARLAPEDEQRRRMEEAEEAGAAALGLRD